MASVPKHAPLATASGEEPPARRYWEGLPKTPPGRRTSRRRPWSRLGTLMVVVGVAEVILVAGVVTNWFGIAGVFAPASPAANAPVHGPSPNPFGEKVDSLEAAISYTGNTSGYFPDLDHVDVCHRCPLLPTILWDHAPPEALFPVFFNVTNTGSTWHVITNFTLSAGQSNQSGVFELFNLYCCPGNDYTEDVDVVGFVPGQTLGLEAYILATNVPSTGGVGYDLILSLVSPD